MPRRHTISAALVVAGALTIVTLATTAGAQSPSVSAPRTAQSQAPTALTAPSVSDPIILPVTITDEEARAFQINRQNTVVMLQAAHTAQLTAIATSLNAAVSETQGSMWSCIRSAESGDDYGVTSGAYGILVSTWYAYSWVWAPYGDWSVPGQAPAAVQDLVAYHLYAVGGGFGGWHDRCTDG